MPIKATMHAASLFLISLNGKKGARQTIMNHKVKNKTTTPSIIFPLD